MRETERATMSMTTRSVRAFTRGASVASVVSALALVASCGAGAPHGPTAPLAAATASSSAASSVAATASARSPDGLEPEARVPPTAAERWMWGAVACWVGPPWAEAVGAVGAERALVTDRRCRIVAHDALGVAENDAASLRAMGDVEPAIAARIADAIAAKLPAGDLRIAWIRAVAPACREAWEARRAAQRLRAPSASSVAEPGARDALVAYAALQHLGSLAAGDAAPLGERASAARLVVLILAADRIETARDLPAAARLRAMAPALAIVFGGDAPTNAAGVPGAAGEEAFVSLLTDAARRGGQVPVATRGASLRAREAEAFASVVAALADRFDGLVASLGIEEGARVARGYALRLHQAIEARVARPSGSAAVAVSVAAPASASAPAAAAAAASPSTSASATGSRRR
jgi:hypothetical protein